ncbi:hypothetical protein HZS_3108 [Henneguya salminicola]|nr:hypothetical protein HZS_3108 [Henneguya salminicola]
MRRILPCNVRIMARSLIAKISSEQYINNKLDFSRKEDELNEYIRLQHGKGCIFGFFFHIAFTELISNINLILSTNFLNPQTCLFTKDEKINYKIIRQKTVENIIEFCPRWNKIKILRLACEVSTRLLKIFANLIESVGIILQIYMLVLSKEVKDEILIEIKELFKKEGFQKINIELFQKIVNKAYRKNGHVTKFMNDYYTKALIFCYAKNVWKGIRIINMIILDPSISPVVEIPSITMSPNLASSMDEKTKEENLAIKSNDFEPKLKQSPNNILSENPELLSPNTELETVNMDKELPNTNSISQNNDKNWTDTERSIFIAETFLPLNNPPKSKDEISLPDVKISILNIEPNPVIPQKTTFSLENNFSIELETKSKNYENSSIAKASTFTASKDSNRKFNTNNQKYSKVEGTNVNKTTITVYGISKEEIYFITIISIILASSIIGIIAYLVKRKFSRIKMYVIEQCSSKAGRTKFHAS